MSPHIDREAWVHLHMARAGLVASRAWDGMTVEQRCAAARSQLCASRGLPPSSGCRAFGLRDFDARHEETGPALGDSEGGEI